MWINVSVDTATLSSTSTFSPCKDSQYVCMYVCIYACINSNRQTWDEGSPSHPRKGFSLCPLGGLSDYNVPSFLLL